MLVCIEEFYSQEIQHTFPTLLTSHSIFPYIGYMFMDGGYEKSLFDLFLFADEKSDFMELVGVGQKDWA